LYNFASCGQNTQKWIDYNGLTELNISSETYSKKLYDLSDSNDYYRIYNNGTIDISRLPYSESDRNNVLNVAFGTIIGTNLGEWGGELFFRSFSSGVITYTIIKDNVVGIFCT
jgi:hypothetical protein